MTDLQWETFSYQGVIAAAVLYFLQVATGQYTEYWPTVLGLILLVILMFVPEGLVGLAKRVRGQLGSARAAAPEPAPAPAEAPQPWLQGVLPAARPR